MGARNNSRETETRRKRAVQEAQNYFLVNTSGRRRTGAAEKEIARAGRPMTVAKRLVSEHAERAFQLAEVDLSDVAELQAKLYRRDFAIFDPQRSMLSALERAVAKGEVDAEGFKRRAAGILGLPNVVSKKVR